VDPLTGVVRKSNLYEGIILSDKRATYTGIQKLREGSIPPSESWEKNLLPHAWELYECLKKRRHAEGKILFESTELLFQKNKESTIFGIEKRERSDAHMLIEEFMVLANEEVAKYSVKNNLLFLSRIHEHPGKEQTEIIKAILHKEPSFSPIEPKEIRQILENTKTEDELYRLSRILLPKMAKAYYGEKPLRHFGLALSYYTHFTSPIRRYPDLLLHRILKYHLERKSPTPLGTISTQELKKIGKSLTEKERKAEEAERAVKNLSMCRYMLPYKGKRFKGRISGMTETTLFVELSNGVE
jgi:ribonuclease R